MESLNKTIIVLYLCLGLIAYYHRLNIDNLLIIFPIYHI